MNDYCETEISWDKLISEIGAGNGQEVDARCFGMAFRDNQAGTNRWALYQSIESNGMYRKRIVIAQQPN